MGPEPQRIAHPARPGRRPAIVLTLVSAPAPGHPRLRQAAIGLGRRFFLEALWIGGGALFFLIRFSAVFYRDNQPAVDALLDSIRGRI